MRQYTRYLKKFGLKLYLSDANKLGMSLSFYHMKLKRLPVRKAVFGFSIQPRLDAYVSGSCSRAHNRVVTVLAQLEPIFFFFHISTFVRLVLR